MFTIRVFGSCHQRKIKPDLSWTTSYRARLHRLKKFSGFFRVRYDIKLQFTFIGVLTRFNPESWIFVKILGIWIYFLNWLHSPQASSRNLLLIPNRDVMKSLDNLRDDMNPESITFYSIKPPTKRSQHFKAPDCCAGGRGFEPQTGAFVIISAHG